MWYYHFTLRCCEMPIPWWGVASFWGVAVMVSFLLGRFCFEVHVITVPDKYPLAARMEQWWFNFIGALFGWAALWCLVLRIRSAWRLSPPSGRPTFLDLGLAFVAFVGISGYLPYAVKGVLDVLRDLALEALRKLTGLAGK
jgi:hypothetical protein